MSKPIKLIFSPILFYQERVAGPPRWASPVAALICYGALSAMASALAVGRMLGDMRTNVLIVAAGVAFSVLFVFALQTGVVVCLERLFSSGRNGRRLIECSALAYWTQVPLGLLDIGFWGLIDIEDMRLPASAGIVDIIEGLDSMQSSLFSVRIFTDSATYYSLWVVALQAAALRAVSKFSIGGSAVAGCFLGLAFVVLPWIVS